MKKKIKLITIIIPVILIAVGAFVYLQVKKGQDHKNIKVSGIIEGDDVRISFRVHGKITELLVDEGYVVKTGDIVARLDTDQLSQQAQEAQAALIAAEHQLKLDADDYGRAENMFGVGAISTQQRDTAKTTFESSKANVDKLRASLQIAKNNLGYADLASPLNGYILVKSALAGEVVQVGAPVFTAIDLNNIWVTAYINETDLAKVKLNQKAYVTTDTYPNKKYNGWVSFISSQAEFTPKYIQTTEERVKYVYRIKVRADNSTLELKPGMPADAFISLE